MASDPIKLVLPPTGAPYSASAPLPCHVSVSFSSLTTDRRFLAAGRLLQQRSVDEL